MVWKQELGPIPNRLYDNKGSCAALAAAHFSLLPDMIDPVISIPIYRERNLILQVKQQWRVR